MNSIALNGDQSHHAASGSPKVAAGMLLHIHRTEATFFTVPIPTPTVASSSPDAR